MTEAEWLACGEPGPMLLSLVPRWRAQQKQGRAVNFERLRLFACACCRLTWDLLDRDNRRAIEMIEEYARVPTRDGLRRARKVRWAAGNEASDEYNRLARATPRDQRACLLAWARNLACGAVWQAADKKPTTAAACHVEVARALAAVRWAQDLPATNPGPGRIGNELLRVTGSATAAALLRDIAGNPFRGTTLDRTWLSATVVAMAQSIDDERDFGQMPILADALEDAGCDNNALLAHCRGGGEHVRGCWVIDALLNRQ